MTHMLIRHKVEDFGEWKPLFEDHRQAREAAGLKGLHVWRNADDPSEVILLFEASDLAKAKEFAGASELKEKMKAAGIQGSPDIVFLEEE